MGSTTAGAVTARSALVLLILGIAFGAATAAVNHGLGPGSAHLSRILVREWGWLCAGFLACWAGRSWWQSLVRGLSLLLPATVTHATLDRVLQARTEYVQGSGPGGFVADAFFWGLIAVVSSAGLAVLVALIRRGGDLAVIGGAALPALITRTAHTTHARADGADPVLHEVTGVIWPLAAVTTLAVLVVGFVRLALRGRPKGGPGG